MKTMGLTKNQWGKAAMAAMLVKVFVPNIKCEKKVKVFVARPEELYVSFRTGPFLSYIRSKNLREVRNVQKV